MRRLLLILLTAAALQAQTDLAVNDIISWRVTNLTASRNPTITDLKMYCEKRPE